MTRTDEVFGTRNVEPELREVLTFELARRFKIPASGTILYAWPSPA
jgi:hypothetical protein